MSNNTIADLRRAAAERERDERRPPGILGAYFDYQLNSSPFPDVKFAQQASLILGSVALARRFTTDRKNWSLLYGVAIGETGCGKEASADALETVLEASGLGERCGPRSYTSAAGVASALAKQPAHLSVQDEFGDTLKMAQAAGQSHKRQSFSLLRQLWGMSSRGDGGRLRPAGYATQGMTPKQREQLEVIVQRPSPVLLGLTTPGQILDALSIQDLQNGLLNRLLIVVSDRELSPMADVPPAPVPRSLIAWLKKTSGLALGKVDAHDAEHPPEPVVVPFGKAAWKVIRDFELDVVARRKELIADRSGLQDVWVRTVEMSMRIALIVAVSMGETTISSEAATWSTTYMQEMSTGLQKLLSANLAGSDSERVSQQLLQVIDEQPGITLSELARVSPLCKFHRSRERQEFLIGLLEAERIRAEKTKPLRGKATARYFKIY